VVVILLIRGLEITGGVTSPQPQLASVIKATLIGETDRLALISCATKYNTYAVLGDNPVTLD
jgi:hypothetical protein